MCGMRFVARITECGARASLSSLINLPFWRVDGYMAGCWGGRQWSVASMEPRFRKPHGCYIVHIAASFTV